MVVSGAPGGDHGPGDSSDELSKEERRLRLWAFATSPHGLGLSSSELWRSTPREIHALRKVYDSALYRWAIERAMYANVHFRKPEEAAFIPEDFLGRSDRTVRSAQQFKEKLAVQRANQALQAIRPGVVPEGLPDWARG